ncbi:MAG: ROK family protein [Dehalococcoidia bacterium]
MARRQQPARLAQYNRAVILDIVRRSGPLSRAELAERSGLAASSVLNVVSSLAQRGLVRTVAIGPSTGGRPPALVELNAAARYAIGANIRITGVEAVLLDLAGDIVAETDSPLRGGLGVQSVVTALLDAVDQVLRLGQVDPRRVLGVGVGCPGLVMDGRTVLGAPSLPFWQHVPLARYLEDQLKLPVTLENDANLGALAEYRRGIGRAHTGDGSMVYVYVDHGIGAGFVLHDRLWRGTDGIAGEFGHTLIDINGPACVCGSHGCLEAVASVAAILRRSTTAANLGFGPSPAGRAGGAVSIAAVLDAVEDGDPIATASLNEALAYLAAAIVNLDRQLRPGTIVVGGELFSHRHEVFQRLQEAVAGRPQLYDAPAPRLVLGELGAGAAAVGAGALVLEDFFGAPEDVISADRAASEMEPVFEQLLVLSDAEVAGNVRPALVGIVSAGNLEPMVARLEAGESLTVRLDVELDNANLDREPDVKVLLHWDRVPLFGSSWPSPKNSPMRLIQRDGARVTYELELDALPPGKYEYAVHALGANDIWVPGARERNGRAEVYARHSPDGRRSEHEKPDQRHEGPVRREVQPVL